MSSHAGLENRSGKIGLLIVGAIVTAFVGCGRADRPALSRVSGAVLYGGKPVQSGEVMFTPDGSKQNKGRQGLAVIKNGRFDSRGSRAPGIEGGHMIVRVIGFLDTAGKRHFRHEFAADLARDGDVVMDLDIDPRDVPEAKTIDF